MVRRISASMSCFTNCTHSEYVDDVLSAAKKVLTTSGDALEAFPVPGMALAAKILVSLIDRIEVRSSIAGIVLRTTL